MTERSTADGTDATTSDTGTDAAAPSQAPFDAAPELLVPAAAPD